MHFICVYATALPLLAQIDYLQRFLETKDLPQALVYRIMQYYNFLWEGQKGIDEKQGT